LTPTASFTSTISPTPTLTSTPLPTATPTRTPVPTLAPNLRYPPAVLVLHSNSNLEVNKAVKTLDNVKFLKEFLPLLKDSPFTVTTFEKLETNPDIKNPLILMIDQFYWGIYLTKEDGMTFQLINQANYPAVITIVPVPIRRFDNNAMVGEYLQKGWEIANNTDSYEDMSGMDWTHVAGQVGTGGFRMAGSILVGRHQLPITLVPPYGKVNETLYKAIAEIWNDTQADFKIKWVVAAVETKPYNIQEQTSTVGYVEAKEDAKATLETLIQNYIH
jgi:hypothetical protein